MTFTQLLAPIYVPLEDAEFVFCHPSQLSHASVSGLKLELTFFFFRTYFFFIFFFNNNTLLFDLPVNKTP